MNYGKKQAVRQHKQMSGRSNKKKKGKHHGIVFLKFLLLLILCTGIGCTAAVGYFVKGIIDEAPDVSAEDVKPSSFTTFVYADDKKSQTAKFVASGSNRVYKSLDQIPEDLQHAFVAIEDERFYEHNGIDVKGIIRAAVVTLTGGSEGASTITQQLVKNNIFTNFTEEKTFYDKLQRKLQEQYISIQIEKQMSKEEILESYMNTINLGQGCLGVQSASKRYFNKDVSKLKLSEAAVIAGITQSPSNLNPVSNPKANKKRQHKVLKNMLEQGYIDQAAYDEAIEDNVYDRVAKNDSNSKNTVYSYFVDALSDQVINDLQEQLGYSESQAYNALYSGGLSIYSTQNKKIQKICNEEMNKDSNYPELKEYGISFAYTIIREDGTIENYGSGHIKNYAKKKYGMNQLLFSSKEEAKKMVKEWKKTVKKKNDVSRDESLSITVQPQASVTIIDQSNGQIKAMVGGRGKKRSSLSLNRAYKGSKRQPGSTFKVLAAYAPAIDAHDKTLATTVLDEKYVYDDGTEIHDDSSYKGEITYRTAIEWSVNVAAVKVSDEYGQQEGYDYCTKFGISTLVASKEINGKIYSDLHHTLALGGITDGVYNYELCNAYATIANKGVYNEPTMYTKILDHDGNILLDGTGETRQVIKETTAALLTSALVSVVEEGTGMRAQLSNMPVAGKTGTTTSNKDVWFVGFTPYYTCAVWGGYDENKELGYDTQFRFRIWTGIMSRVHENKERKEFDILEDMEYASVCPETGLLASNGCNDVYELFPPELIPTEYCSEHYYESYDYDDDEDYDNGYDEDEDYDNGYDEDEDDGTYDDEDDGTYDDETEE